MRPFSYVRAEDPADAIAEAQRDGAEFIAGGTTLVDLMRLDVMHPSSLVDVNALPLASIDPLDGGGLRIGAMARNTEVAYDPRVISGYPVLSQALLSGASPQLRNMATVGGNVLQRTRCSYFRDPAWPCNKRTPGSGCSALDGYTRMHAVLGTSDHCIAAHPSDMCVALAVLDAVVRTRAPDGTDRTVAFNDFHTLPADRPEVENVLRKGELITAVDLPASPFASRSRYLKVRDRASYAFALASAAVALAIDGGVVRQARVAMGGVGTKPWRSTAAEAELVGKRPADDVIERAASAAIADAQPRRDNAFKIDLAKRVVARALRDVRDAK